VFAQAHCVAKQALSVNGAPRVSPITAKAPPSGSRLPVGAVGAVHCGQLMSQPLPAGDEPAGQVDGEVHAAGGVAQQHLAVGAHLRDHRAGLGLAGDRVEVAGGRDGSAHDLR
jgi:hypothetical protein